MGVLQRKGIEEGGQGHRNTVSTVVGVSEAGKPCDQILLPRFGLWAQLAGTGATPQEKMGQWQSNRRVAMCLGSGEMFVVGWVGAGC